MSDYVLASEGSQNNKNMNSNSDGIIRRVKRRNALVVLGVYVCVLSMRGFITAFHIEKITQCEAVQS